MRKTVFAFVGMAVAAPVMAADTYTIDPNHTFPNFTISHLGFSTMYGRFGKTSGAITMDEKRTTGSVDIVIDASSVDTGMQKRDDHLRSPDFLNVVETDTVQLSLKDEVSQAVMKPVGAQGYDYTYVIMPMRI